MNVLEAVHQDWPLATEIRKLQSRLWRICRRDKLQVILLTSAVGSEGKTTTTSYLAATSALMPDRRVLAVDLDFRRPQMHNMFGLKPHVGLAELLRGACDLEEAIVKTSLPNLDLILAGKNREAPGLILDSARTGPTLDLLRSRYDLILLDTPPLVPVADAAGLIPLADGVLLVVMAGKTTKPHLEKARELCLGMGGNILGLVVGNAREAAPDYYHPRYYYDYGYHRGSGDD